MGAVLGFSVGVASLSLFIDSVDRGRIGVTGGPVQASPNAADFIRTVSRANGPASRSSHRLCDVFRVAFRSPRVEEGSYLTTQTPEAAVCFCRSMLGI